MNIVQHHNPYSEPVFRRLYMCKGCHGRTKINRIWEECSECRGDGYVESDDWMWAKNGYERCHQCIGKGGWYFWDKYCCQQCYEQKLQDDYDNFMWEEEQYWNKKYL